MTGTATRVPNYSSVLRGLGYNPKAKGLFTKPTSTPEVSFWVAISRDQQGDLISLGAVSAELNKFAFQILREVSLTPVRLQFSPDVAPPLCIERSSYVEGVEQLVGQLEQFETATSGYSMQDWAELALRTTPYLQAQLVLLPAYFLSNRQVKPLAEYLERVDPQHLTEQMKQYLAEVSRRARDLAK